MNKKLWLKYSLFILLAAVITVIDQLSKIWIVSITNSVEGSGPVIIDGILKFTYLQNEGASMGIFEGQRVFLIVLSVLILLIGGFMVKKYKPHGTLLLASLALVAGGAVGNLIDRIMFGYVRDFIEVLFIKFYIFNIADCAICIGAALLMLTAFFEKEE